VSSTSGLVCDNAKDYIVMDYSECPYTAVRIKSSEANNPKVLFGNLCCLVITDFTSEFYEKRYSESSFACRSARSKLSRYLLFHRAITTPNIGVMQVAMQLINELNPLLTDARQFLNDRFDLDLRLMFDKTQKVIGGNGFQQFSGCGTLREVFEEANGVICGDTSESYNFLTLSGVLKWDSENKSLRETYSQGSLKLMVILMSIGAIAVLNIVGQFTCSGICRPSHCLNHSSRSLKEEVMDEEAPPQEIK
jgi:hypothetical protein